MISLVLIVLAGFFKAVADTVADHWTVSVFRNLNPKFWCKDISWKYARKVFNYKVDAWHLSNSAMIVCFVLAAVFHQAPLYWLWDLLIAGAAFNLSFNLFYDRILKA